jgi:hypothetical protein
MAAGGLFPLLDDSGNAYYCYQLIGFLPSVIAAGTPFIQISHIFWFQPLKLFFIIKRASFCYI